MSKACVKHDGESQEAEHALAETPIPPGTKNYFTPKGAQKLKDELKKLMDVDRPEVTRVVSWAASNGDRSENADYIYGKRRLREIDRRIRFLTKRLDAAEVLDPRETKADSVRFGATVVVGNEEGEKKTYSIVGVDEIDAKRGHVSWLSPLGKALLKAKVGNQVSFRTPKGEVTLDILEIHYKEIE